MPSPSFPPHPFPPPPPPLLLFLLTLVPPNSISITSSGPQYGTTRTIVPPRTDVTLTLVFIADTLPNVTWVFNNEDIQLVNNPGFNVTGPFLINTDTDMYKVCVHIYIVLLINEYAPKYTQNLY